MTTEKQIEEAFGLPEGSVELTPAPGSDEGEGEKPKDVIFQMAVESARALNGIAPPPSTDPSGVDGYREALVLVVDDPMKAAHLIQSQREEIVETEVELERLRNLAMERGREMATFLARLDEATIIFPTLRHIGEGLLRIDCPHPEIIGPGETFLIAVTDRVEIGHLVRLAIKHGHATRHLGEEK